MDFKPFKIGKYLLLERLATGGMAEVYRAKASGAGGFEKQLAIKRILPNYSANEEFRRMFEYEAQLSSRLTHANIVQVYDFVKSGDTYLLAMEYVDGKNLRQVINKAHKRNMPLPIPFAIWVINEVGKGLEYAHRKKDDLLDKPLNIIHRDMSPQNIMLSYDGEVKIVDFGIAKAKDRVDETRSGVIKGKFGYMSPEQANGHNIDHRSDVFSSAIILWELLTNKRLFSAENDMATLKLIQECVIPNPTRLNPKIPSELERILLKALTKDLNLRYQNAGIFHKNLQVFISKTFPTFTQKDVADTIQEIFRSDIEKEKKRFEQIYRQSIPFSQGDQTNRSAEDLHDPEEEIDGEVTKSEHDENTPVTSVDEASNYDAQQEKEHLSIPGSVSPSEETQLAGSQSGITEDTQADAIFLEDQSVPTLSKGSLSAQLKTNSEVTQNTSDPLSALNQRNGQNRSSASAESKFTPSPLSPGSVTNPSKTGKSSSIEQGVLLKSSDLAPKILMNEEDISKTRRRDRSISALNSMRGSSNKSISLMPVSEQPIMDSPKISQKKRRGSEAYDAFHTDYMPRRTRKSRLPFIATVILVLGIGYLFNLYEKGGIPTVINMIGLREPTSPQATNPPTKPPTPSNQLQETVPAIVGDCLLVITTDPGGASVFINNKEAGVTTASISVDCNSFINLNLKLNGYEVVAENIKIKDKIEKIYHTLKRIPMGHLELTLNRNANVYLKDQLLQEAEANQPFRLSLRAGRSYTLRFKNEVLGIDVQRQFTVELDSVLRATIRLENTGN